MLYFSVSTLYCTSQNQDETVFSQDTVVLLLERSFGTARTPVFGRGMGDEKPSEPCLYFARLRLRLCNGFDTRQSPSPGMATHDEVTGEQPPGTS